MICAFVWSCEYFEAKISNSSRELCVNNIIIFILVRAPVEMGINSQD